MEKVDNHFNQPIRYLNQDRPPPLVQKLRPVSLFNQITTSTNPSTLPQFLLHGGGVTASRFDVEIPAQSLD